MSGGGGFPPEWFSQPLDQYLFCSICSRILRHPKVTPCGHVFCSVCITYWVERYGVCPKRCEEVEIDSLRLKVQLEKFISGLYTHCKNKRAGCTEQVRLVDKHLHEKQCQYRKRSGKAIARSVSNSSAKRDLSVVSVPVLPRRSKHKRTQSSVSAYSAAPADSVSAVAARKSPSSVSLSRFKNRSCIGEAAATSSMNSKEIFTTHTFRLKRTKPREPLGLVLLSGEKTSDGRPKSFYVKEVHPDTLGWRAGVQAKDQIIQVDYHDLASINPQEAVARIKERPLVNITVLRGSNPRSRVRSLDFESGDNHVYEEILYSDYNQSLSQGGGASQGHSQGFLSQDDNGGGSMASGSHFSTSKNKPAKMEDRNQRLQNQHQQLSSSLLQLSYARERNIAGKPAKNPRERGSKDSGLSSGSSVHQDDADPSQGRHGFVGNPHAGESSLHNRLCRTGSGGSGSYLPEHCVSNIHCRVEGDFEVEDIYLQKNGTSQLGITLGYNTEVKTGGLHVCEVVPNGLAAQNGRLRSGDIIRRVNGFEVHDPEEAILLFLEQDQDITLSVARLLKTKPGRIRGTPPRITTTPPRSFGSTPHTPTTGNFPTKDQGDHNYAVLETAGVSSSVRRVDSCGTLDSRKVPSRQAQNRSPLFMPDNEPDERVPSRTGYDKMRRTKSTGSSSSWSARRREQQVKSVSPPAVTRQPSPLVNHHQQQQQQQQEEPTYQVLESSPSTYQVLEPTSSTYQVLESSSPVYHVLQSPPANKANKAPPPSYRNPPPPSFLDEPFELFTDNPPKVSPKAAMFTSSQQLPSSSGRPASAGPHGRFRIGSSSTREKFDTRNNHMHGSNPPANIRSYGKEAKPMRPDIPVDYRTESLV